MILAPTAGKAKIAIAQRTSEGDLPYMGKFTDGSGRRRGSLEQSEGALHLAGLVVEPFRFMLLRRTPAALIDCQNRSVEDAIAQCLHA